MSRPGIELTAELHQTGTFEGPTEPHGRGGTGKSSYNGIISFWPRFVKGEDFASSEQFQHLKIMIWFFVTDAAKEPQLLLNKLWATNQAKAFLVQN